MIQEKKNKQNQQQKPNKIKGGKRKKNTNSKYNYMLRSLETKFETHVKIKFCRNMTSLLKVRKLHILRAA